MGRIPRVANSCSWRRSVICTGTLVSAARPVAPCPQTKRGCPVSINQLFFHLVAGPKVKLLRRLIVLVDDAAIGSGKLNRVANDGAEHRLEIKRGADRLADLAQALLVPRPIALARWYVLRVLGRAARSRSRSPPGRRRFQGMRSACR